MDFVNEHFVENKLLVNDVAKCWLCAKAALKAAQGRLEAPAPAPAEQAPQANVDNLLQAINDSNRAQPKPNAKAKANMIPEDWRRQFRPLPPLSEGVVCGSPNFRQTFRLPQV